MGAGPRKSKSGGIQKRTRRFLAEVLSGMITIPTLSPHPSYL